MTSWYINLIIVLLFLALLVIIAQILLDRSKFPKIKPKQENDSTYEKIKQLKNELREDTRDKTPVNPVFDILVKHKKTDSIVSKYKPQFSVERAAKLEELQEELDVTKKDITEDGIEDVQEEKLKVPNYNEGKRERKIEELIRKT